MWDDGGTWAWWPMWLGMILFWGGLIWLGVWLVRRSDHNPSSKSPARDPRRILEDRFARGEIDEEELERGMKVLGEARR